MKLTKIEARAFIGVREVDLAVTAPVLLLASGNGHGKSSLTEAIRATLDGEHSRVTYKKELHELVHDGHKSGSVVAVFDRGTGSFAIPSGKHGLSVEFTETQKLVLPHLLDMHGFARLDETAKRKLLFALSGVSLAAGDIRARLEKRDIAHLDAIMPLISRGGFEPACKHAQSEATQAKGAWRAVTGENWGSEKGAHFTREIPAFDQEEYTKEQARLVECRRDLDEAREGLGRLRGQKQAAEQAEVQVYAKEQSVERKAQLLDDVDRLQAEADRCQKARDAAVAAAEQAEAAVGPDQAQAALRMPTALEARADGLLDAILASAMVGHEWQPDAKDWRADYRSAFAAPAKLERDPALVAAAQVARAAAVNASKALTGAQGPLAVAQGLLRAVEADEAALARLRGALPPPPSSEALAEHEGLVQRLTDSLAGLAEQIEESRAAAEAHRAAVLANEKAFAHHRAVLSWDHAAKALAPDGVIADIVSEGLAPIGNTLKRIAEISGWEPVEIHADMRVTSGGRALALVNRARAWKADAMLTLALAIESGVRWCVLENIDTPTPSARAELVYLLDDLVADGALDGALLAMATEQTPSGLPESCQVVQLSEGRIA